MRGTKPKPSLQQKRFIELFKKNVLTSGTKGIKEMMEEAGYAPESVRQYSNIMAGIRPHLDPFVQRMDAHREKVMTKMEEKVDMADYASLTRSLDVLTENMRLLTGKTTSNVGVIVGDRRGEIDRLIDE